MNKTTIVDGQTKDIASSKPTKRIRDGQLRRKDERSVDHVLKALDSLGTPEEKLGVMCQKYAEMFNDHRVLQASVKQAEKKNTTLQKEKEQLQAEHSKAILTRSRLENLCRELQRQNKAVKEECMLKMREEGEKKREVAAKFHSMLSEIGSLLAQNNDKNAKLRDDNLDMSMRLKSVCDQFEKKEQHVENLAKQMQLEMQLADAKLAKARMEMDIEKETLEKEKQQLLIELAEYKRKLCEMQASELSLREQITMYSEKYEEFHKALLQSNSCIGDFKAEMERMTKHIRRLEKETATWKLRYDATQRALADVTQGKFRSDEALALSQRRLVALQGICRGLQDQCRQLRDETGRNSQCDEDYKRLEAQIKEVERVDELDYKQCPRRISSETSPEAETTEEPEVIETHDTPATNCLPNGDGAVVLSKPIVGEKDIEIIESLDNIPNSIVKECDQDNIKEASTLEDSVLCSTPNPEMLTQNSRINNEISILSSSSNIPIKESPQITNIENSSSPVSNVNNQEHADESINSLVNQINSISVDGSDSLIDGISHNSEFESQIITCQQNPSLVTPCLTEAMVPTNTSESNNASYGNSSIVDEASQGCPITNGLSKSPEEKESLNCDGEQNELSSLETNPNTSSQEDSSNMKNKKKRKSKK